VQASLKSTDGGTIFEGPLTTGRADLPRPAAGRYVLSARTLEADGFLGREGVDTIIDLPAPPAPPALAATGSKPVTGARPALRWPASAPDASYRLQIATDPSFAAPMVDRVIGSATSVVHDTDLPPGSYGWRVAAATEPDGPGPFSAPQAFRTEVPAASYEVQLAQEASFSAPIETLRTTERRATFTPPKPGEYFARVRGLDADGEPGPYSNAVSMKILAPLPWWVYPFFLFGIVLP